MDSFDLVKALTMKSGKERQNLYEQGTYFMAGILGGMFFNDIYRTLRLPPLTSFLPDNEIVKTKGNEIVQGAFSAAITMMGLFAKVPGATAAGSGMLLGAQWSQHSQEGKYIGAT